MAAGISACSPQQNVVKGADAPTATVTVQLNLPAQDQLVGSDSETGICKENSGDCTSEATPTPASQSTAPAAEGFIERENT